MICNHQLNDWIHALYLTHLLSAVSPDAVLAGGAARDTLLGKPIKDYDIFIPIHRGGVQRVLAHIGCIVGRELSGELITPQGTEYKYGRPEVLAVLKIANLDVVLYDELVGRSPDQIVRTFDCGLSQAWFDKVGRVRTTDTFDYCRDTRRNYFRELNSQRVSRLARKFPEWEMVLFNSALHPAIADPSK